MCQLEQETQPRPQRQSVAYVVLGEAGGLDVEDHNALGEERAGEDAALRAGGGGGGGGGGVDERAEELVVARAIAAVGPAGGGARGDSLLC